MRKKHRKPLQRIINDLEKTLENEGIDAFEYELMRLNHYGDVSNGTARKIKFLIINGPIGKRLLSLELHRLSYEKNLFNRTLKLNKLSSFFNLSRGRLMLLADEQRHQNFPNLYAKPIENEEDDFFY